jgi:hypothetical protein
MYLVMRGYLSQGVVGLMVATFSKQSANKAIDYALADTETLSGRRFRQRHPVGGVIGERIRDKNRNSRRKGRWWCHTDH